MTKEQDIRAQTAIGLLMSLSRVANFASRSMATKALLYGISVSAKTLILYLII